MRDRLQRKQKDIEGEGNGIERRELLGLLGMSGLLLATSRVDAATREATPAGAATAVPQPPCDPYAPCPTTAPPLPAKPDVAKLSALAKLIGVLVGPDTDARKNRRHFNNCPDKFVHDFFGLSEEEIKTFLGFTPDDAFFFLAKGLPAPDVAPDKWKAFLKLNAITDTFWTDWPNYPIKDCYDDPPWCTPEVSKQYAHPETKITKVEPVTSGGVTTLTVTCEGVVTPFTMQIFDASNNEVPVTNVQRTSDSTFRCCRVTGNATLVAGTTYVVRLTISGFAVEHKFIMS